MKLVAIAGFALLAGCGGGGGSNSAAQLPVTNPPPPSGTNNAPPTISGTPGTAVMVGQAYSFTPTASDPNGDTLTFSAASLPSWATIRATDGRITGTPAASNVGTFSGIVITVSDGKGGTASLAGFGITVSAAPTTGSATLSWTPPTQNTDGSTMANDTALASYQILYGRSASNLDQSVNGINAGTATYVVPDLASGTWFFAVVAINASGASSAQSNVSSKTI